MLPFITPPPFPEKKIHRERPRHTSIPSAKTIPTKNIIQTSKQGFKEKRVCTLKIPKAANDDDDEFFFQVLWYVPVSILLFTICRAALRRKCLMQNLAIMVIGQKFITEASDRRR